MQQLINPKEALELNVSQEDLATKFLAQLQKDFDACGMVDFFNKISIPLDYTLLVDTLEKALMVLEKQGFNSYQQLFYRIDLPEKQIAKLSLNIDKNKAIAELIIKRILQKVILKIQYSKK